MAHAMKSKRGAVYNLLAHDDRTQQNIGNPDIDRDLSKFNIDLIEDGKNGWDRYNEVLNHQNVHCMKRNDVNTMVSWVITSPLAEDEISFEIIEDFFVKCNRFLRERYEVKIDDKTSNIVSSIVHADETTPHFHFKFVPLVEDKKKGGYKVNAKNVLNLTDLQSFHEDLQDYLLEHDCFFKIVNESLIDKDYSKSIKEIKQQTKAQECAKRLKLGELDAEIEQRQNLLRNTEKSLYEAEKRLKTLEKYCDVLEEGLKASMQQVSLLEATIPLAEILKDEHSAMKLKELREKEIKNRKKIESAKRISTEKRKAKDRER